MNKRQREKQAKKLRAATIEVGDTVEVLNNSLGGFPAGTTARVVGRSPHSMEIDNTMRYVSDRIRFDHYPMIHRVSELKLIKKGPKRK